MNINAQHAAALTGCVNTALSTNVKPSVNRRDTYVEVAEEALLIANDLDSIYKDYIITCLKEKGRVYAKRPVMISIYGGKLKSFADYTFESMKEYHDGEFATLKCAFEFAKVIKQAIDQKLSGGKEFEIWIQEASKQITKYNVGINWITPDGFKVVQDKKKTETTKIEVRHNKNRYLLNLSRDLKDVDVQKNKNCISPNYVHSLDATHLRMTLLSCNDKGVEDFNMIHDSFGCNMNNAYILAEEIRKQWVNLYKGFKVCKDLQVQLQYQTKEVIKDAPFLGGWDIEEVLDSEYFFA